MLGVTGTSSSLRAILEEELSGDPSTPSTPHPHLAHTLSAGLLLRASGSASTALPPGSRTVGVVCELAFRKHFVSLACQVGRQSLWQVPCPMSASTLEWEITCKESHVLFFVKHFKTGHLHLSSCMGMEFCRIPSEHLVPTHSHSLGQGLFPTSH